MKICKKLTLNHIIVMQYHIHKKTKSTNGVTGNFRWLPKDKTKDATITGYTDRRQTSLISSVIGPTGSNTEVTNFIDGPKTLSRFNKRRYE